MVQSEQQARKIRLGINGFGRIGRAVAKIASTNGSFSIVAINELNDNLDNAVYLYNYDSTYGRADPPISQGVTESTVMFGGEPAHVYHHQSAADVPWDSYGVDILIEATGVSDNVEACRTLVSSGKVPKVVISHSPKSGVDRHIMMGVNDTAYDPATDHIVSSVICDSNAIAHVLAALEDAFGIEHGFITTLHPWLSYQNLVDGPVPWQASPGAYWTDYSLGRSSIGSLIPKNTTAVSCLEPVMPDVARKLRGFSYRVPTDVVCSADLTISLQNEVDPEQLISFLRTKFEGSRYVKMNDEALVSVDFKGLPYSAVIDARWVQVLDDRLVKIVLWYDNEWGYSNRVMDIALMMGQSLGQAD